MILQSLSISRTEFETATGWQLKPEGACHGAICVPLPSEVNADIARGIVDVSVVAERLGMPIVHDAEMGLWALGPASMSGRALATAVAPELELPDLDGNMFQLSSLRGKKVVIVSWAPY